MMEQEENDETKGFIKVDVEGGDKTMWLKLKLKLTTLITNLLETKINEKSDLSTDEEIKRATANLIEFANAKLEKPSIENQKLLVEIDLALVSKAKCHAETRKLNAEAEKLEIENITNKLKLAIGLAKVLGHSTQDESIILFVKGIEEISYIFQDNKLTGTE
jgi:hypothetical protein